MGAVSLYTKTAFGVGQIAEGVKNSSFNYFLFFFYHQALGLSGTLTGLALFIATAFDAVTDPLAGSWSDRFRHGFGRRHPFMYASALPLGISFAPDRLRPDRRPRHGGAGLARGIDRARHAEIVQALERRRQEREGLTPPSRSGTPPG